MKRLTALFFAVGVLVASGLFVVQAQMSSPREEGGGVTWPLTATDNLDMDSNNILNVGYLESDNADVADAGVVRLGDGEAIGWEYAAGSDHKITSSGRSLDFFTDNSLEALLTTDFLRVNGDVISSGGDVGWYVSTKMAAPADGQVTIKDNAETTGIVLDANDAADTLIVKDLAGTGTGNVGVSQSGKVCLNGATCSQYLNAVASQAALYANADGYLLKNTTGRLTHHDGTDDPSFALSTSQSANGTLFTIATNGRNSTPSTYTYANPIVVEIEDNTATDEDASLCMQASNDGAVVDVLCADMTDGVETVELKFPLVVPTFTHYINIPAGAVTLGPTSPSLVKQDTFLMLEFDAATEEAGGEPEIPDCYTGDADLYLEIYWAAEAGDAIADGETVKWDCDYRSVDWGSDATDNGTAVSVTATYTQSGAGTDSATHKTEVTIDYDNANQPVAAGDTFGFVCNRDTATDTYSGAALLNRFEIEFPCNGIPNH